MNTLAASLACLLPAASMVLMAPPSAAAESERSLKAEVQFKLAHPCPGTGEIYGACPGYVIDRIVPALCGGAEEPANMQWQTIAAAKEKDRWERIGCRRGRTLLLPQRPAFTEAYPLTEPAALEGSPLPKK